MKSTTNNQVPTTYLEADRKRHPAFRGFILKKLLLQFFENGYAAAPIGARRLSFVNAKAAFTGRWAQRPSTRKFFYLADCQNKFFSLANDELTFCAVLRTSQSSLIFALVASARAFGAGDCSLSDISSEAR